MLFFSHNVRMMDARECQNTFRASLKYNPHENLTVSKYTDCFTLKLTHKQHTYHQSKCWSPVGTRVLTNQNDWRFGQLEHTDGVLPAHRDVDVDGDLRQVLDPDDDRRDKVAVQPRVIPKHLPPQVHRLEDEGQRADDAESEEGEHDWFLQRSVDEPFADHADVDIEQPVADEVGKVKAEEENKVEDAARKTVMGRAGITA